MSSSPPVSQAPVSSVRLGFAGCGLSGSCRLRLRFRSGSRFGLGFHLFHSRLCRRLSGSLFRSLLRGRLHRRTGAAAPFGLRPRLGAAAVVRHLRPVLYASGFGAAPPRRRGRRWRRRFVGLQELDDLGVVPQFAVQQQQKSLFGNLRIFRKLGRDAHLRHLGKWQLLLHLPPLSKVVLDLLRNRLLARGDIEKQNRLRLSRTQQPPGARGSRCLFADQFFRQFLAVFFHRLPGGDELLVRKQALNLRQILICHALGEKIQRQRRRIDRISRHPEAVDASSSTAPSRLVDLGRASTADAAP